MQITYHPQRPPGRPPHRLDYDVDGDTLTVTYTTGNAATTDTFDFSGLPDGALDLSGVETNLPVQPILAAERIDGVLHVTLIDWKES